MMFAVRRSAERGYFDHGWLKTHHTFSFGDYYDPQHHHFRNLRVMNEDFVDPGQGFGMHPHRDMEIVTYILSGALQHKDSLGNGEVLRVGEFQRMTAGSGIYHSEFNPSASEAVHLYQIWLFPEVKGLPPSYEQKAFPVEERQGLWQVVASRDARAGSLLIHTDASVLLATTTSGQQLDYVLTPGRFAWLQVLRGTAQLNSTSLSAGDGVAISEEPQLTLQATSDAEFLLFELA